MTYNWQTMDRDEFLSWILPVAIAESAPELIEHLSEATNKFTEVTVVIGINGIRLDGERLLTAMYSLMQHQIKREATRLIQESPGYEKIQDAEDSVAEILKDAQRAIKHRYQAAGLEFPSEDW